MNWDPISVPQPGTEALAPHPTPIPRGPHRWGEMLWGVPGAPLATQKLLSANSRSSSQPLLTPLSPAEEEVAQTAVELGLSLEEMH